MSATKHIFRRLWCCWLRDTHWTATYRGFAPMRSGHCSCCGTLIYDRPHELESLDIVR
jgi:hypothetical protein